MMAELGHEPTAAGVAALFADLLDLYLIDPLDAHLGPAIRAGGARPVVARALMRAGAARPPGAPAPGSGAFVSEGEGDLSVWAVVVARTGPTAKSRLGPVLDCGQRIGLARAMLADVVAACRRAELRGPVVVTEGEVTRRRLAGEGLRRPETTGRT